MLAATDGTGASTGAKREGGAATSAKVKTQVQRRSWLGGMCCQKSKRWYNDDDSGSSDREGARF